MKRNSDHSSGRDERRVREVPEYHERQTDDEAAAEHEAALSQPEHTLMSVPTKLVPAIRNLIAEHERDR